MCVNGVLNLNLLINLTYLDQHNGYPCQQYEGLGEDADEDTCGEA